MDGLWGNHSQTDLSHNPVVGRNHTQCFKLREEKQDMYVTEMYKVVLDLIFLMTQREVLESFFNL